MTVYFESAVGIAAVDPKAVAPQFSPLSMNGTSRISGNAFGASDHLRNDEFVGEALLVRIRRYSFWQEEPLPSLDWDVPFN